MPAKISSSIPTVIKLFIFLIIAAAFAAFWYFSTLPNRADEQQTIVIGPSRFTPASQAAVRVVVQNTASGEPVSNAGVKVSLQPESGGQVATLFSGTTDASGSLPLSFQVPAEATGDYRLIVETESRAGNDRLEQPVTIERDFRLLLTSDKPLYQPGQTIHLRALAFDRLDLTPARGMTVNFLVQDAKGNKVFRQSVPASGFGVAAVDFTLADMVNQGNYQLSAAIGTTVSEKTVEVRPYNLPKFGINLVTDRSFYSPGQRVEGTIQADYFFGKPVAGGAVRLVGVIHDIERVEVIELAGQTDQSGQYAFGFDLPDYFAGSGLDSQQSRFALEVTVIDQTEHAEQTGLVLPVAAQPIVIEAVAESGTLRPGVENILYILTAYPDGSPARTNLEIRVGLNSPQSLVSEQYGLAEFRFVPQQHDQTVVIEAYDERGFSAARSFEFQLERGSDQILLRADRATYLVGETMNLTALTNVEAGSIYLDIVKEGQTLSTRSQPIQAGRTEFTVDLDSDMYGSLELHAYKVLGDGTLVRDTRVVVVDEARDLAIDIAANQESYLPGEMATLNLQTSSQVDGAPVQTALGLAVVDESVFALQRQDPGFAKLYFLLEAELLEPAYQVKGFELPASYGPGQAELRQVQDVSTRAAWSNAPTRGLALQANSRLEKIEALRQNQRLGLQTLTGVTIAGLTLIPPLLWLVVILALRGSGVVRRSLVGLLKVSGILLLVLVVLYGFVTFISSVSNQVERLFRQLDLAESLLFAGAAVFGLALLGLAVYAWRRGDEPAKFIVLLTASAIALFGLLFFLAEQAPEPDESLLIPLLAALILVPGAYLLFGQMLWAETRRGPGWLPTIMGGVTTLPVLLLPLLMLSTMNFQSGAVLGGVPEAEFMVEEAMPLAATEMALDRTEAGMSKQEPPAAAADEVTAAGEPPRLRQFFPETLYWNPEVVTDEAGRVEVAVPIADSITTWRLTALASSQDGRLGFSTQGLRVFQDFFVDVDLPLSLTQGDEISIPVGVFNYLPEAQEVRLVVEPEPWFELLGDTEQTLTIASNDISVVYFPIRVVDFGRQGFQLTAWGEKMSDAVRREVRVAPNGKEIRLTDSNWLRETKEITLDIPPEIVPRTTHVEVKIYTGALAQVIEGLEKILRLPHG